MDRPEPLTCEQVVVRIAGDSGDGMQVTGGQLTHTTALAGNDLVTMPDFPAEIRAPAGSKAGVSAFQIQFASGAVHTPGDYSDVLVAMNPAALATNVSWLRDRGIIIANLDRFAARDIEKAGLSANPLDDGSLGSYQLIAAPMSTSTRLAIQGLGLGNKEADRCKNFFALGILYWMFSQSPEPTRHWIRGRFQSPLREANLAALEAGYDFAENTEIFQSRFEVPVNEKPAPGTYRSVTGNGALAMGLAVAAQKAGRAAFYAGYPITPASDVLHAMAEMKGLGVLTFQAEDEIAAVCAAIGAAWGGAIGVCGTSGPGLALKAEALGLAVSVELPLVVVDVQRAGPSTGMPTKSEQSDLMQALFGRNGEAPVPIVAPSTPADCFDVAIMAVRIAVTHMVPVIILSDGYIGTGAQPWRIPDSALIPAIDASFEHAQGAFQPYDRDPVTLARPWVVPGTPGVQHRVGGLEKEDSSGNVSYEAENHQRMCELRVEKVRRVRAMIPPLEVHGTGRGLLVLGWGSSFGAIRTAVDEAVGRGLAVSHVQLRVLNPLPADLGDVLRAHDRVLVPELNLGQLVRLIRADYLVDAVGLPKVRGVPFMTSEIAAAIDELARSAP